MALAYIGTSFNSYQLSVISYQFHPQGLSPPPIGSKALVAGLNPPPYAWYCVGSCSLF
jgi:hypothetical protein